jgi:hypothetical protein
MAPRAARLDREKDNKRLILEEGLLNTGWRLVRPRWAERDDQVYEKNNRRILVDRTGCFVYKYLNGSWERHRGIWGYDNNLVLAAFDQVDHREWWRQQKKKRADRTRKGQARP